RIDKVRGLDGPEDKGFVMVRLNVVSSVRKEAGTVTCNCMLLTTVPARLVPFSCTLAPVTKLLPVMVSDTDSLPSWIQSGLMADIVATGFITLNGSETTVTGVNPARS